MAFSSASVVRSPQPSSSDAAALRKIRRLIFPLRFFGEPDARWITSTALKAPMANRTCLAHRSDPFHLQFRIYC